MKLLLTLLTSMLLTIGLSFASTHILNDAGTKFSLTGVPNIESNCCGVDTVPEDPDPEGGGEEVVIEP